MKLWVFLFPPPAPVQSARVAAPAKGIATALLGAALRAHAVAFPDAMIVQWGGELGDVEPAVLQVVRRAAA